MRIVDIKATPLSLPLEAGFSWAGGLLRGINMVLFTVRTDDGIVGYGESVCEDPGAAATYGDLLADHFIGRKVSDVEAGLRSVSQHGRWRFWPHFTQMLVAGIEVAAWDALGKTLGVPTSTFFGGSVREEVDFCGFAQGASPEEIASDAAGLVASGYEVIYVKLGRQQNDDVECVAAIREAVGYGPALRVDPNESWDVGTAIERIRAMEPLGLDWVEQPVDAGNVGGLAQVRQAVSTKIAADQAVFTTSELLHVLEKAAADVVVQGSHDAGGLLRFRQQAYICEAFGIAMCRHAFVESAISFMANLQVASTIPNLTRGNQALHHLLATPLTKHPDQITPVGGRVAVPDAPGHGFELDEDAVMAGHERWRRDGAYPTTSARRTEPGATS